MCEKAVLALSLSCRCGRVLSCQCAKMHPALTEQTFRVGHFIITCRQGGELRSKQSRGHLPALPWVRHSADCGGRNCVPSNRFCMTAVSRNMRCLPMSGVRLSQMEAVVSCASAVAVPGCGPHGRGHECFMKFFGPCSVMQD